MNVCFFEFTSVYEQEEIHRALSLDGNVGVQVDGLFRNRRLFFFSETEAQERWLEKLQQAVSSCEPAHRPSRRRRRSACTLPESGIFKWLLYPFRSCLSQCQPKPELTSKEKAILIAATLRKTFAAFEQLSVPRGGEQEKQLEPKLGKRRIRVLRMSWKDSSEFDILRRGHLSPEKDKILRQQVKPIPARCPRTSFSAPLLSQLVKLRSIQESFSKEYVTFSHGQSSAWMPHSMLLKELVHVFQPAQDTSCFEYLRPASNNRLIGLITALAGYIPGFRDDWFFSNYLLSVDADHYSSGPFESALFYASRNRNVRNPLKADTSTPLRSVFSDYIGDQRLVDRLESQFKDYVQQAARMDSGTLYAICVPKPLVDRVAYRSHSFGYRCLCHPLVSERDILGKLQAGLRDRSVTCWDGDIPQYRLKTHLLTQENGVLIFPLKNPEGAAQRSKLRVAIKSLAEEIFVLASQK